MPKYKDKETQRAEKYARVSQLSEDMSKWITRNEEEWKKYLTTAARVYKYPFNEQLLIHAQKPDATAVASVKIWNERMYCWVNKGSKGIALLDNDYPGENRLKYVFDVADVHKAKRIGRDPNLWNSTRMNWIFPISMTSIQVQHFPLWVRQCQIWQSQSYRRLVVRSGRLRVNLQEVQKIKTEQMFIKVLQMILL